MTTLKVRKYAAVPGDVFVVKLGGTVLGTTTYKTPKRRNP
jgi:hypothetical protein